MAYDVAPAANTIIPATNIKFMRVVSNVPVPAMVLAAKTACVGCELLDEPPPELLLLELPQLLVQPLLVGVGVGVVVSVTVGVAVGVVVTVGVGVSVTVGVTQALLAHGSVVGVGVTVGVGVLVGVTSSQYKLSDLVL